MTHITLPRAVVEQALEALESVYGDSCDALHALRAALAQQAEPDAYGYASYLAVAIWEKYYKDTAPHWKPLDDLVGVLTQIDNMTSGLTRLAQQAEPVKLTHRHEWFRTGGMEQGQFRCIHCGVWGQEQADPQIADHLARHGIQACLYPNCVGGQSGTVCHKHCPTPCPDCRGLGYDASGQLCACQQNPSF